MNAQKKPQPQEVKAVATFRLKPSIKQALGKAAVADKRTMSAVVEIVLEAWLTARGFLK